MLVKGATDVEQISTILIFLMQDDVWWHGWNRLSELHLRKTYTTITAKVIICRWERLLYNPSHQTAACDVSQQMVDKAYNRKHEEAAIKYPMYSETCL